MERAVNRDFETPTDIELTSNQMLDAERLVVDYVYQSGELPKEVELEDFTVVSFDECITEAEEEALKIIIRDNTIFDFDFEEFYMFYIELAGHITSNKVKAQVKDFIICSEMYLERLKTLKVVS